MDFSLSVLIGSIIGLVDTVPAFTSGSETSLTSASKARMHTLARSGKRMQEYLRKYLKIKNNLFALYYLQIT